MSETAVCARNGCGHPKSDHSPDKAGCLSGGPSHACACHKFVPKCLGLVYPDKSEEWRVAYLSALQLGKSPDAAYEEAEDVEARRKAPEAPTGDDDLMVQVYGTGSAKWRCSAHEGGFAILGSGKTLPAAMKSYAEHVRTEH